AAGGAGAGGGDPADLGGSGRDTHPVGPHRRDVGRAAVAAVGARRADGAATGRIDGGAWGGGCVSVTSATVALLRAPLWPAGHLPLKGGDQTWRLPRPPCKVGDWRKPFRQVIS